MSLPDSTTVLIVGAGPAGLAAALSLLHHGFQDFVIVDAIPRGQNSSRACVLHAATLETLDMIGCADDIVSHGAKTTTFSVGTRAARLLTPDIGSLKAYTRHPYVLVVPQSITERLLEEQLSSFGVTVHRPLKVVGLKCNETNSQLSDATLEDGRTITTKYVIGADGARSAVRDFAGIGFSDPTFVDEEKENNLAQVIFADVTFDTTDADDLPTGLTLSPQSLFLFFPFPSSLNKSLAAEGKVVSERIYRIGCGVPLEEGEIPHTPPKEYLQRLLDRFAPIRFSADPTVNLTHRGIRIKDVVWSSRFRNRAALADTTFCRLGGVVLLIGDAAHIHSPTGGQGMNLGLRDGVLLGEALTEHLRAAEDDADAILREFAATREGRAREVIALTKRILALEGMRYRERVVWWFPVDSDTVRAAVLWVLGCVPYVRRKLAWELSGLGRR